MRSVVTSTLWDGGAGVEVLARRPSPEDLALGGRVLTELLDHLAGADAADAQIAAVVAVAACSLDVDAVAYVCGEGEITASAGRAGEQAVSIVKAALGSDVSVGDGGPLHLATEPVPGPGARGRLVVVHRRLAGLDEADRTSLQSLSLVLGLALRSLPVEAPNTLGQLDALTGLPGRTELLARIERSLGRPSGRVAILFVDLDRFKTVNDSLGHGAGDELLSLVAARLRACVRPADTAARLDGDEFALLLADQDDPALVAAVAERVRAALREPYRLGRGPGSEGGSARDVHLDASIGIAIADHETPSGEELLHDADLAMAKAKADGRGRIVSYAPGMHEAALVRMEMEAGLRTALSDDSLSVHFQPIHRLVDGALVGVEALARWRHPVLGSVPPSVFVPVAEHTGSIVAIGCWVLGTATAEVAAWRRSGLAPDLTLSVNLSPRQLERSDLVRDVADALDASGLPAGALVLEITESVLLEDVHGASERLRALRDLGVRVAIDDFGTGYATLGYLQQLPADILKVDKSFVDDICSGPERSALARAVIKLGRSLGLSTTAEGIESVEQLEALRALGCEDGQGYLFSRPLDVAALSRLLAEPSTIFP